MFQGGNVTLQTIAKPFFTASAAVSRVGSTASLFCRQTLTSSTKAALVLTKIGRASVSCSACCFGSEANQAVLREEEKNTLKSRGLQGMSGSAGGNIGLAAPAARRVALAFSNKYTSNFVPRSKHGKHLRSRLYDECTSWKRNRNDGFAHQLQISEYHTAHVQRDKLETTILFEGVVPPVRNLLGWTALFQRLTLLVVNFVGGCHITEVNC